MSLALAHPPSFVTRFARFCVVGASGVIVDMAVLWVLADPHRQLVSVSLAKALAAETALINNFLWNDRWTFRDRKRAGERAATRLKRLLKFNAICGLGIGFSVLLINLFYGRFGWNLYLSNFLAIFLVTVWNFGMNARFNWSQPLQPGCKP
jgi:dolichol-phosphate mannosyltransferase